MRKPVLLLLVLVLAVASALGLAACGTSSGKEGGKLTGSYASFPDYLDPGLSYTQEGWTAMYNTYLPLLTYAHANGTAGGEVVPGPGREPARDQQRRQDLHAEAAQGAQILRRHAGQGVRLQELDRAPLQARAPRARPSSKASSGRNSSPKTKSGGITGIKTNDKTGEIVIDLTQPRGTFTNELGTLFAALLPSDTPAKNLSSDPPPATGPYAIVKSEPGRGWSYKRNPHWTRTNGALMPDLPDGHFDKIEIKVVSNDSTQVNEIERDKTDWMQSSLPADLYAKVKNEYEGSQFRVERPLNIYFFWMNTARAALRRPEGAPGGQLRGQHRGPGTHLLRLARRRAPDPAGGDAGARGVRPLPARHGQGQGAARRSQPLRSRDHGLDQQRKPQRRGRRLLPRACSRNSASTRS